MNKLQHLNKCPFRIVKQHNGREVFCCKCGWNLPMFVSYQMLVSNSLSLGNPTWKWTRHICSYFVYQDVLEKARVSLIGREISQ